MAPQESSPYADNRSLLSGDDGSDGEGEGAAPTTKAGRRHGRRGASPSSSPNRRRRPPQRPTTTDAHHKTGNSSSSTDPAARSYSSGSLPSTTAYRPDDVVPVLIEIAGATDLTPAAAASIALSSSSHHHGGGGDEHSPLAAAASAANVVSGTVRGAAANASAAVGNAVAGHGGKKANPYVRVNWNGGSGTAAGGAATEQERVVHKTEPVSGSNDPIWAVDTGSVFAVEMRVSDLLGLADDDNGGGKKHARGGGKHKKPKLKTARQNAGPRLTFEVRDKDMLLHTTATIGYARVYADALLDLCDERRIELDIVGEDDLETMSEDCDVDDDEQADEEGDDAANDDEERPKLALRFRLATNDDLSFLRRLKGAKGESGAAGSGAHWDTSEDDDELNRLRRLKLLHPSGLMTEQEETSVGFQGLLSAFSHTFAGTKKDKASGETRIRVKPHPDPARPEKETIFLTEDAIRSEAYKPSTNWIEAGSGSLGRVYVEIIGCRDLPNLDSGEAVGNKTDSFVCAVYEDSVLQTDVIDDILSPLWMPWTQRAFAFNRIHPLSALYLGVFDYDIGPLNQHDGIGRVAINLSHFAPDVTHTLCYKLYPSSVITDRKDEGSITVRLRIESVDERKMLLAAVRQRPPRFHINVRKTKSLGPARYTVEGRYDEEKYDMTLLRSYINEIMEYKRAVSYSIGDALRSLVLWRGQVKVGRTHLPLHSAAAFLIGIRAVEKPHMLPGLCFLFIAWVMLANMTRRVQQPSPWRRCTSFGEYFRILRSPGDVGAKLDEKSSPGASSALRSKRQLRGSAVCSVRGSIRVGAKAGGGSASDIIKSFDGAREQKLRDAAYTKRVEADFAAANKQWELQQELDAIGEEDIETKEDGGIKIDPLARLLPYQRRVGSLCYLFRTINTVITWEESMVSFWITLISLGIAVVLLILPTAWILHWLCRIAVWTFLGPWMRLVDTFLLGDAVTFEDEKDEERHREATVKELLKTFRRMSREARVRGEEALKLKAARILRFGKYIISVPSMNVTRHFDYPLPDSYAQRCAPGLSSRRGTKPNNWDERAVIPGQMLFGTMIPGTSSVRERQERAAETSRAALEAMRRGDGAEGSPTRESEADRAQEESHASSDARRKEDAAAEARKREEGVEIELFDDAMTVAGEKCPLLEGGGERKAPPPRQSSTKFDDVNGDIISNLDGGAERPMGAEERQAAHTEPQPKAIPSQIEPDEGMGMDEISVLSMCEPMMRSPRTPDGGRKLKSLEEEGGSSDTEEEGVEIVELLPLSCHLENDDGDGESQDDVTVTPVYRASDNVSVVFCQR